VPEQSHPPYVSGALTIPRQLERWLDVNPQNGPLKRTETYITVPAFTTNYFWIGYSDIIVAFNFEAPNNFSLRGLSSLLDFNPNYYLCISYRTGTTLVRYALWQNVGEVLFFNPPPLYTGQMIKKNFRLEVWSTSQGAPINALPFNIYTSVRGNIDYRYGTDSQLVASDAVVTSFADNSVGQVNSGLIISGTGTNVDGVYSTASTVNGKPAYTLDTDPSNEKVEWDGLFWLIEYHDGAGWHTAFRSGENVVDPSHVVTWVGVAYPPPLPVVNGFGLTNQYTLPLTFPANAVSQSN
jgi:hypothetical protein